MYKEKHHKMTINIYAVVSFRLYRYIAYRHFTRWIYHILGKKKKKKTEKFCHLVQSHEFVHSGKVRTIHTVVSNIPKFDVNAMTCDINIRKQCGLMKSLLV